MTTTHKVELTNAQEMAAEYPDTFNAPPLNRIGQLEPGDLVNVAIPPSGAPGSVGERFWLEIVKKLTDNEGDWLGRVASKLHVFPQIKLNDLIRSDPRTFTAQGRQVAVTLTPEELNMAIHLVPRAWTTARTATVVHVVVPRLASAPGKVQAALA